jgi:hypothetical protein
MPVGVIGVPGAKGVFNVAVIFAALILIANKKCDGRTGRFPLEDP